MKIFIAKRNCFLVTKNLSKNEFDEIWNGRHYYYISLSDVKKIKKELREDNNKIDTEIAEKYIKKEGGHLQLKELSCVLSLTKIINKELDNLFK